MSTDYDLKAILAEVATGEKLNEKQAEQAFNVLMSGQATPSPVSYTHLTLPTNREV